MQKVPCTSDTSAMRLGIGSLFGVSLITVLCG